MPACREQSLQKSPAPQAPEQSLQQQPAQTPQFELQLSA